MGLEIARNSLQETCFALVIVGVTLAITATVLRFFAVHRSHRKPGWEDGFAVLATFFFILYAIPLLYLLSVMNGSSHLTADEAVRIKKAGYSMGPQFCMQQLFAKLSLLFLYYRIFSINRTFVYWVWFLGIVQVGWSFATYMAHWLECIPTAKVWEPTLPGQCISSPALLAGGETPNSLIDFALIALAIWMVQSLQVNLAAKMKLFAIFILGGLAGVLGFVKIGEGFAATSAAKIELLDPIWATVQQTCSVICCCAPVYRTLIPELGLFSQLRSFGSTLFSRSRSSKSGTTVNTATDARETTHATMDQPWMQHQKHWVELDDESSWKASSSHITPSV